MYNIIQREIILTTVSKKIKFDAVKRLLQKAFGSRLFPFVTAAVIIFCYYLSLDLVAIYYVAITGILILLFCDDLTPFITLLAFMCVIISYKNSPSDTAGASDYFFRTAVFCQVVIAITLLVCTAVYRLIKTCCQHKFKLSPIFLGLCVLSATFLLNGAFSEHYTPMNLLYGLFQAGIYAGLFALLKDNVKIGEDTFEKIALTFLALSILLVIELFISYFTYEGIYIDGKLNRDTLMYGWGVYNTMGMLLVLCIPAVIYLAGKYKHGYVLTIYSLLLVFSCFLTTSRQAMVGVAVIYPLSIIYMFIKSRKRLVNLIILLVAVAAAIAIVIVKWNSVYNAFSQIFANVIVEGQLNGSGRIKIYRMAIDHFSTAPVFGVGFYSPGLESTMNNVSGLDIIPYFYHNTILQMMASCGFVGLFAYLAHRTQTVMSYFKNITVERSFIAVAILALLIVSLLDVHMFDILPTLTYSSLLAVLAASEKKRNPSPGKSKK